MASKCALESPRRSPPTSPTPSSPAASRASARDVKDLPADDPPSRLQSVQDDCDLLRNGNAALRPAAFGVFPATTTTICSPQIDYLLNLYRLVVAHPSPRVSKAPMMLGFLARPCRPPGPVRTDSNSKSGAHDARRASALRASLSRRATPVAPARTIWTFSSDTAYSSSPAASRASVAAPRTADLDGLPLPDGPDVVDHRPSTGAPLPRPSATGSAGATTTWSP